ncbi:F-box-like [Popillia japonica]|uniref:F-box-like n=1 Tax=Popillia japonica TaxID=7064 RepID=A0AAW1LGL9_POPJA
MRRGCWKVDDEEKGASVFKSKGDRHHTIDPKEWLDLYKRSKLSEQSDECSCSSAIYIDIDEDDRDNDDGSKEYSRWADLPDLLLEKIFSYLSIREKYYASLVCKSWYRAFHLPYVWSQFVLEDSTLTRGRFNYYSGWQYVLDHLRTQMCLSRVGRNFRHLTFEPMMNFYNLYEFMNMISWYIEQTRIKKIQQADISGVGCKIRTLKFTFPCDMSSGDEDAERARLFGTGGRLLDGLKRLMSNLQLLKRLELVDLMLEPREAAHLLDEVCEICCLTLRTLILINTTKFQYQLLHVGVFLNLEVLMISPQNLGSDVIELIGYTKLKHLYIMQNKYTPDDILIKPIPEKIWKICRKNNPELKKYYLRLPANGAPVRSIIYDSPQIGVENDSAMTIIEMYRNDIAVFGHMNLPKVEKSKSFHERADSTLLLLCRLCPKLTTLIITEWISTTTLLLIATTARNLRYLYVRREAVIKKCDWPQSPDWSDEFYEWLKENSRRYSNVESEISQILGYNWRLLSDTEFKMIEIDFSSNRIY